MHYGTGHASWKYRRDIVCGMLVGEGPFSYGDYEYTLYISALYEQDMQSLVPMRFQMLVF